MIKKVYSTLSGFKPLYFHKGLNIILADVTENSKETDTRNGLGKTTLVKIINFLFGASKSSSKIFNHKMLKDQYFCMDLSFKDDIFSVKRKWEQSDEILLEDIEGDLLHKLFHKKNVKLTLEEWKEMIGKLLFNIDKNSSLSFRSIYGYFNRLDESGGFSDPLKYFSQQKVGFMRVYLAFLIGLNYELAVRNNSLVSKKKEISDLKKALNGTMISQLNESYQNPERALVVLEKEIIPLKKEVDEFSVYPQYEKIEKKANELALQISKNSNKNFNDKQLLTVIEKEITTDFLSSEINVSDIYDEAGLVLPDKISKRINDVRKFHESVVKNRQHYLENEKNHLIRKIKKREDETNKLSNDLSKKMQILNEHGAVRQYIKLQDRLSELVNKQKSISEFKNFKKQIDKENAELKIEQQQLVIEVIDSLDESHENIEKAISLIESISSELYDDKAILHVGQKKNTGEFDFSITSEKDKSDGINHMLIFMFDFMLLQMCKINNRSMDFLIHDSGLFDPVDQRQIEKAILLGGKIACESDMQYIVTLNSDDLSHEFLQDISPYLVGKLTDKDEKGTLLGFYF